MITAVVSFLFGLAGALLVSVFGRYLGFIDTPGYRSSHSIPTPKGGGIGILAAVSVVSLVFEIPLIFIIGCVTIALLGLYGDYRELSPGFRLSIQFLCAALVLPVFFKQPVGFDEYLLVLCWIIFIVGTANFYNFMDGINGIAGITGFIAFSIMAAVLLQQDREYAFVAVAAACSCLGFLPMNLPNARVFMGDVGSILLGFLFASLVCAASTTLLDFLCYAAVLFPFYIDELSTMTIRLLDGEKLFQAHRRHLYQLLANEEGLSHWKVSFGFAILQIIVASSAYALRPLGIPAVTILLLIYSVLFIHFSLYVRKHVS